MRIRALLAAACLGLSIPKIAAAEDIPPGWLAWNMEPVGYIGTEHRRAFKLAIKEHAGRWYLFTAYAGDRETKEAGAVVVLDVTDPANPKRIVTIPGPAGTDMGQVSLHGDLLMTNFQRFVTRGEMMAPAKRNAPGGPPEGIVLWSIADPAKPVELGRWETGAYGTHRNSYPGGRYAFVTAARPDFRGMQLVVLDVSNPKAPKEVTNWYLPGQAAADPIKPGDPVPNFHGPAQLSPDGKRMVMAFQPYVLNMDVTDITRPTVIGKLQLVPPFPDVGAQSLHTALPYWDKGLLYVSGEARFPGCTKGEHLELQAMIDNRDPAKPSLLSLFPAPVPPKELGIKSFCDRAGRFGPHNISTEIHNPDVAPPNDLIHVAYFNAGMQVYDIKDPRMPTIAGYFIPADSPTPEPSQTGLAKAYIAQDTLTDRRGYVYMIGSGGLYILRDTSALKDRTLAKWTGAALPEGQ